MAYLMTVAGAAASTAKATDPKDEPRVHEQLHDRSLASRVGFEPTTQGLKVPCSATELPARARSVADETAAEALAARRALDIDRLVHRLRVPVSCPNAACRPGFPKGGR